jgi:phosphoribosyl 1,2-cyclic phosphodiesterase
MRVRFWGVRGSVPWATAGSIGYGCNTPCVEIVDELSDRRLILDAGSGIVGVGATLDGIMNIPIVLTHYHWDHVQGLPFFSPLYRPGCAVTVWAPALGRQFADIETMFESPFFPVPYDRLPSRPAIRMYGGERVAINGFDVRRSRVDRGLALHAGRNTRAQRMGPQRLVTVRAIRRRLRRAATEAVSP